MAAPYPDFPPNYTTVRKHGSYDRDCLIIDLSTLGELDSTRMAQVEDAIAMAISNFPEIEKHRVVRSTSFNTELSRALRL